MTYVPTTPLPTSKLPRLDLELLMDYKSKHGASIIERLGEFSALKNKKGERAFYELCYCILTPQSKGLVCDRIIASLAKSGVLNDPLSRRNELEAALQKTRFWRNKSKYIIKAHERFNPEVTEDALDRLLNHKSNFNDPRAFRTWLRKEMKGLGIGMKEASHFLRNIGHGEGLAIVDRHVLNCMVELGVIAEDKKVLRSEKEYIEQERRILNFSHRHGVPVEELDLLLWSAKTGYIFK
jgi:N-glycosylase/DNA lyase